MKREYRVTLYVTVDSAQIATAEDLENRIENLLDPHVLEERDGLLDLNDVGAEDLGAIVEHDDGRTLFLPRLCARCTRPIETCSCGAARALENGGFTREQAENLTAALKRETGEEWEIVESSIKMKFGGSK